MNPDDTESLTAQAAARQQLFRSLPRPQPRAGLGDDIRQARRAKAMRAKRFRFAIISCAASVLFGLAIVLRLAISTSDSPGEIRMVSSVHQPEQVNFLVTAKEAHEKVTFSLLLPPEWEFYGYQGQQSLSWPGKLKAGNNLLSIPVVALQPKPGVLIMQIRHKDTIKEYKLYVDVKRDSADIDSATNKVLT